MKKILKIFSILLCAIALNFSIFSNQAGSIFKENTGQTGSIEKKVLVAPEVQEILVLLETGLDIQKSRQGEPFIAKTMDDIFLNSDTVLIPTGSIITGEIIKVKKPGFIFKDAYISISIDTIKTGSEKTVTLEPPFVTDIYDPASEKFQKKIITRLPSSIASSGSSFILGQGTSMTRGAILGISAGAGIMGGIFSGLIMPDKNKTRAQTCTKRAIGSTPPIKFHSMVSKGKVFRLKAGEFINIHFKSEDIKLIMDNFSTDKDSLSIEPLVR